MERVLHAEISRNNNSIQHSGKRKRNGRAKSSNSSKTNLGTLDNQNILGRHGDKDEIDLPLITRMHLEISSFSSSGCHDFNYYCYRINHLYVFYKDRWPVKTCCCCKFWLKTLKTPFEEVTLSI